jgi:hypothetical protein
MALSTIFVDHFKTRGDKVLKLPQFKVDSSEDSKNKKQFLNNQSLWYVDASVSETYSHEADMTDNPVEKGIDVTDHYSPRPVEITMKMMQSETPLGIQSLLAGAKAGIGQFGGKQIFNSGAGREIGGIAPSVARLINKAYHPETDVKTRVATCYELFKGLIEDKQRLTITTGLSVYSNMMIKSLTVNRDKGTGEALDFTVTLKQVIIIQSETIKLPRITVKENNDRASGKDNKGQQSAKKVPEKKQSVGFKIFQIAKTRLL